MLKAVFSPKLSQSLKSALNTRFKSMVNRKLSRVLNSEFTQEFKVRLKSVFTATVKVEVNQNLKTGVKRRLSRAFSQESLLETCFPWPVVARASGTSCGCAGRCEPGAA